LKSFVPSKNPDRYSRQWILCGFFALILIHISFVFLGFYGSDDINYARYAAGIANNGISFEPATYHFQLRWTPVYSTAFFYKIFGINAFSSTLFSATAFALCGYIIYKTLLHDKPAVLLLALTLFLFNYSVLFYMHRIMPDPAVCLSVLWMYHCYRAYFLQSKKAFFYGACFALALLLAVISKESIVIALPLFLVLFVKDMLQRQRLHFWKYAGALSIVFIFLYLLYFKTATGDFFFRYHLLQEKAYQNICSFQDLPFKNTLERIGYKLWQAMFLNGDVLTLLPALAAVVYKNKVLPAAGERLDAFSFVFLLLLANFMSISFSHYVPLCQDPRHFMFVLPFAAILGGPMLYAYFKEPLKYIGLPLLYAAATIIMFLISAGANKYFLLLFTLLLGVHYFIFLYSRQRMVYESAICLFVLLSAANYMKDFVRPQYPFYADHRKIIKKYFADNKTAATVFSADDLSAELSEYFMGFETGRVKFASLDSVTKNEAGTLYYLLNGGLNSAAKLYMDSVMKKTADPDVLLIQQSHEVRLYKVNNNFLQKIKSR
jgi:hypothetical protein